MRRDDKFLKAMGIEPCSITEPIPHDWTEKDIRTATMTPRDIRREAAHWAAVEREKAGALDKAITTIALMDEQAKLLRGQVSKWKVLAWSALLSTAAFLTAAIMLAKGSR